MDETRGTRFGGFVVFRFEERVQGVTDWILGEARRLVRWWIIRGTHGGLDRRGGDSERDGRSGPLWRHNRDWRG